MRQSCGKSDAVVVYSYGKTSDTWWDKIKNSTTRFNNLQVVNFSQDDTSALEKLANRSMRMQVNIQDGEVMVSVDDTIVNLSPVMWKAAAQ